MVSSTEPYIVPRSVVYKYLDEMCDIKGITTEAGIESEDIKNSKGLYLKQRNFSSHFQFRPKLPLDPSIHQALHSSRPISQYCHDSWAVHSLSRWRHVQDPCQVFAIAMAYFLSDPSKQYAEQAKCAIKLLPSNISAR